MKIYAVKTFDIMTEYDADISYILQTLDADRQKKVLNIKHSDEKIRSIFAGLLLRYAYMCEGYTSEQWKSICVKYNEFGKPFIDGANDFHYSLSHSGEWIICAVDKANIGADIQQKRPWKLQMPKRFYSESEYQRILDIPETDNEARTTLFYKIWTAKESCVKFTGRGIGEGISQYITNTGLTKINKYFMEIYDEIEDYVICVCSLSDEFPAKINYLDAKELMYNLRSY